MKLTDIAIGGTVKTIAVGGEGRIRRRLFDMGVTPDSVMTVKKKAPLGDPIEVTLRGYELTLRRSEAELIEVEEINPTKVGEVKSAKVEEVKK